MSFFPSVEERDRRHKIIRQLMADRDLDGIIIASDSWLDRRGHVKYASGIKIHSRYGFVVFPSEGDMTFVGMPGVANRAKELGWINNIRPIQGAGILSPDYTLDLEAVIRKLKLDMGTIGLVGYEFFPTSIFTSLLEEFPKATFKPASDVLDEARMVKSQEEIKLEEKTAKLADTAFEALTKAVKAGRREREVFLDVRQAIILNGGDEEEIISTPFSDRLLKTGSSVVFMVEFAGLEGYWVHAPVRTVSIGKPKREMEDVYEVCLEAHLAGAKELRPGRNPVDVMKAINNVLSEAGDKTASWAGHGMGLDVGERPFISVSDETPLKPGMVIAIHPAIRRGEAHAFITDTYIITENEPRRLSKVSQKFKTV